MPDLASLPAPRPASGPLQEWQVTLRDLAIETALRHAQEPGIAKTGLSEPDFASLFVALIRRESSFNRRAVSRDGAKGLGQLMPETLRELGVKDPFSAKENLDAAATHFAALLERFGSPALALAAYDAGSDKVLKEGGIPKRHSTRQFVADVLHDFKIDPRPDFLVARLKQTGPKLIASDEHPSKTGDPAAAPIKPGEEPKLVAMAGLGGSGPVTDHPSGAGKPGAFAAAPGEEPKPVEMAGLGGDVPVIGAFIAALAAFLASMAGALFCRPQRQACAPRVRREVPLSPVPGWMRTEK
jgi:hypothetical protein